MRFGADFHNWNEDWSRYPPDMSQSLVRFGGDFHPATGTAKSYLVLSQSLVRFGGHLHWKLSMAGYCEVLMMSQSLVRFGGDFHWAAGPT